MKTEKEIREILESKKGAYKWYAQKCKTNHNVACGALAEQIYILCLILEEPVWQPIKE